MSQLEEQILKQNVLEEHRQVHELQVRIKELRADVERYVAINAQLLEDLEKAETQLAKLREQKPAGYVPGDWRGATTISAVKSSHFNTPLYAEPIPVAAPAVPAPAVPAPSVPKEWREFVKRTAEVGLHATNSGVECTCYRCVAIRGARALLQSTEVTK